MRSRLTPDDRLWDGVATVVSQISGENPSSGPHIWQNSYIKANPTTQITDPLTPWAMRARAISQYVGASMSMICEPMRATRPHSNGIRLFLCRSERYAMGGVAV